MLTVRVTDDDRNEFNAREVKDPFRDPKNEVKSITIQPGQVIVVQNVKWWEHIDVAGMPPGKSVKVEVGLRTPGLWGVPARATSAHYVKTDALHRVVAAQ